MDPMEAINQEEITVGLNGDEALLLMKLFALSASLNIFDLSEKDVALSIMNKLGPGIHKQAGKQLRLRRDGLN